MIDTIAMNTHAPTEDKSDDSKYSDMTLITFREI